MAKDSITILVSGGLDSMACTHFYKEKWKNISGIFIDYGQKSVNKEKKAAKQIMKQLSVPLSTVHIEGICPIEEESGFIQGRNMAFLILGLMNVQSESGAIALGIHSGTEYRDCSTEFIKLSQKIFDLYTDGKFTIGAPFVNWTKIDIWKYCICNNLPIELTYSCEYGSDNPCNVCKSCKEREFLYALEDN